MAVLKYAKLLDDDLRKLLELINNIKQSCQFLTYHLELGSPEHINATIIKENINKIEEIINKNTKTINLKAVDRFYLP